MQLIKYFILFFFGSCTTIVETPDKPDNPIIVVPKTPTAPLPPVQTLRCKEPENARHGKAKDIIRKPKYKKYFKEEDRFVVNYAKKSIYINYKGRKVYTGYSHNNSFIVCKNSANVGGAGLSKKRQELINFYVKGYFKDIGIDIKIYNKPQSDYMLEMIVGGEYKDLGCGSNRGILGIAPLDKKNERIDEIAFAFVNADDSDYMIASTIAHEAGHTFGLEHINNKCGVMYYAITDYIFGFRKGKIRGKLWSQDSIAKLRKNLN